MQEQKSVSVAKALKLKNRLAGRLTKINADISSYNSVVLGREQPDVRDLFSTRVRLIKHLLDLKCAIHKANDAISDKLYLLQELKSNVSFLSALNTDDGDSGAAHYGTESKIYHTAVFKKPEVDKMVLELESEIDDIQDFIDAHNAKTRILVSDELMQDAGAKG